MAFKPTSSITKSQTSLNVRTGEPTTLNVPGRHDVCFALRTPVKVESVAAIVLAELLSPSLNLGHEQPDLVQKTESDRAELLSRR